MRTVMVLVALLGGCVDNGRSVDKQTPDAGTQVDTLAARIALCGATPGDAPVLDPAYYTATHGFQNVLLSLDHWNADADFITKSHDWQRCIQYGAN